VTGFETGARSPSSTSAGWQPKVVALDIDGTLLRWIDGSGTTYEEMTPAVRDAVRRAYAEGANIVLASGRSPHGMTRVADLLGLPEREDDRLWVCASNGAVILRYPPAEVVHEVTFDAREAVEKILAMRPSALVAVEERGVGYRINDHFPPGELTGDMVVTPVEELISQPVSRVIIRDPEATVDEFVALGEAIGLHGISYVVGWTAWLDLTPVGVSKASGLEYIVEQLRADPADVLAIGDGRNDVELLRWAGRGVAMGQAVEDVLAAADDVAPTVDDDGAAFELSRWFPEPGRRR